MGFIGSWRWARAQAKKPLIIGLTCDATGTFADSGQADRRGMILAIEEQNAKGGVLGRPIEARWEDTETDPSVAVRKAQKLIERDKIDFMIGALSSGVAAPLSELAQRYGIIYFNSNSSADTVTGEKCQRVNFVWDANGYMFNQALGPLVAKNLGKKWFILTHDYVWGKNVTAGTRDIMKKVGAEEAGRADGARRGRATSAPSSSGSAARSRRSSSRTWRGSSRRRSGSRPTSSAPRRTPTGCSRSRTTPTCSRSARRRPSATSRRRGTTR